MSSGGVDPVPPSPQGLRGRARDLTAAAVGFAIGAAALTAMMFWRESRTTDRPSPYAEEVERLCERARGWATRDLEQARRVTAMARAPLSGRLVEADALPLMDAIHVRTDVLSETYVRCAASPIPPWNHYLDIPTPNDDKLIAYLREVVAALPAWDHPPPPLPDLGAPES